MVPNPHSQTQQERVHSGILVGDETTVGSAERGMKNGPGLAWNVNEHSIDQPKVMQGGQTWF